MFIISALSAPLVIYIRYGVEESPAWSAGVAPRRASIGAAWSAITRYLPRFLYLVVLMAFFNAFSHGSQDLYPTFLQAQHGFSTAATASIVTIMNVGALLGGICFGAYSERIGRRRAIIVAALLALPLIPLWAHAQTPIMLAVGAFLIQFMVQGAWGIVPAHLNELSPPAVRAILPGFAYQLGNLVVSLLSPLQAGYAKAHGGDFASVLGWTLAAVAVALTLVTAVGPEARSAELKVAA
jgi:SHS family lactate transporter-like MFS transporter